MHDDDREAATSGLPLFRTAARLEALADRIRAASRHIRRRTGGDGDPPDGGGDSGESVGAAVVLPLLGQLGWDIDDPERVVPRFKTRAGLVDYALCHSPGRPRCLVKIGALPTGWGGGGAPGSDRHPFTDLTHRALQLAISGDGREWRLHFPAGGRRLDRREFARADLIEEEPADVAAVLDTYLDFFALRGGWAFRHAESDYRRGAFPAYAPRAWRRVLAGPGVLDRFLAEMADASGVSADSDEARAFVHAQVEALPRTPSPPYARPFRRLAVGDKVWLYNFASRDVECYHVVSADPDFERNEVTPSSPLGRALIGAREGEERETHLPDGTHWKVRIVLVKGRNRD